MKYHGQYDENTGELTIVFSDFSMRASASGKTVTLGATGPRVVEVPGANVDGWPVLMTASICLPPAAGGLEPARPERPALELHPHPSTVQKPATITAPGPGPARPMVIKPPAR